MNDNGNSQDLRHLIQFDKLKRYYNLCEKIRERKPKKTRWLEWSLESFSVS